MSLCLKTEVINAGAVYPASEAIGKCLRANIDVI